eukprot:gnl/MRDRNA2_/MRDRNA2_135181_c0_seq1.p1 gnl/MRDRNA2_/MRDRNA2_135181_c0~~gnl/MRDRNA2_/MRDRNA2_135181_c0_seq1.p1  ORF type:complete len:441 (-),score=58.38 gnl/MRDRNA2_/MRDRNA2_135181_c0_seq1:117-1439(-)
MQKQVEVQGMRGSVATLIPGAATWISSTGQLVAAAAPASCIAQDFSGIRQPAPHQCGHLHAVGVSSSRLVAPRHRCLVPAAGQGLCLSSGPRVQHGKLWGTSVPVASPSTGSLNRTKVISTVNARQVESLNRAEKPGMNRVDGHRSTTTPAAGYVYRAGLPVDVDLSLMEKSWPDFSPFLKRTIEIGDILVSLLDALSLIRMASSSRQLWCLKLREAGLRVFGLPASFLTPLQRINGVWEQNTCHKGKSTLVLDGKTKKFTLYGQKVEPSWHNPNFFATGVWCLRSKDAYAYEDFPKAQIKLEFRKVVVNHASGPLDQRCTVELDAREHVKLGVAKSDAPNLKAKACLGSGSWNLTHPELISCMDQFLGGLKPPFPAPPQILSRREKRLWMAQRRAASSRSTQETMLWKRSPDIHQTDLELPSAWSAPRGFGQALTNYMD